MDARRARQQADPRQLAGRLPTGGDKIFTLEIPTDTHPSMDARRDKIFQILLHQYHFQGALVIPGLKPVNIHATPYQRTAIILATPLHIITARRLISTHQRPYLLTQ
jgi:hypothetical protein